MVYYYTWGFIFGTFKFLFSHWTIFGWAKIAGEPIQFLDIFVPTTAGAIFSMAIFYFLSDFLMERAAAKRKLAQETALANGTEYIPKRKFTRLNKLMVKLKMRIGIYGITILAPLFLSIPVGSIVCAKFYGHHKKTFPLMVVFMCAYSLLMCAIIYLLN